MFSQGPKYASHHHDYYIFNKTSRLRLRWLAWGNRLTFFTPDFFVWRREKTQQKVTFLLVLWANVGQHEKDKSGFSLRQAAFSNVDLFSWGGVGIHIFYGTTSPVSFYSWPQLRSLILGSHQHHVNYGMFLWKPGRKSQISAKTCCFFFGMK